MYEIMGKHESSLNFLIFQFFFLSHASLDFYVRNTCIHGLHNISCCIFDNSHFTAGRHTHINCIESLYERDHHHCIDWDGHKEAQRGEEKKIIILSEICDLLLYVHDDCVLYWFF